jgi:hypothetical protein
VRLSPVEKNIRPWRPEFGPEGKHFVTGNTVVYFLFLGEQRSCDGRGGGAQRPLGVAMSPKRRVRAAHGRARAPKNPLVLNKYFEPDPDMIKRIKILLKELPQVSNFCLLK